MQDSLKMIPELRILLIRTWPQESEHLPSRLQEEVRLYQLAIFIFNFCYRPRMCLKLTTLVFNDGTPISDDWTIDGSRAYSVKAIQRDPWRQVQSGEGIPSKSQRRCQLRCQEADNVSSQQAYRVVTVSQL